MMRIAANSVLVCALAALAACAAAPREQDIAQIRFLLDSGRNDEAMVRLERQVAAAPGHVESRLLLANARLRAANGLLESAAQDTRNEAWDAAQEKYARAAALGQGGPAMVGMRVLASAQQQAQLYREANVLWAAGEYDKARSPLRALLTLAPRHEKGMELSKALAARDAPRSALELGPAFRKRLSLQFRDAPLRAVLESMSQSSGVSFSFDKDVSPDLKVTVLLEDSTVEQALRHVLLGAQLEQRIIDEKSVLIYPNDQARQREHQQLSIRSFRITNAEARQVANSLRTLLKTRDLVVDEKLNMLVLRDTPETIRMAAKLVALHDVAEPEVMLEVEILEVQRSDLESLGIKWPSSVSLSPLAAPRPGPDGSMTAGAFTLNDLLHLNSRSVLASVDPMKISATKGRDSVSVLANPRVRIKSREKALIRVGERVPSVSSSVTSTGVTSQSVNYLDVGLKLEAEPVVYPDDEISIRLSLEVSSILGTIFDSNNQPYGYRIGARNASTVLRLKDGENQVLAGLISDNDRRTSNAVPGLGELPVLDRLFGSKGGDRTKTEIVLSITPRLVRGLQPGVVGEVEFDAGTDASLRGRDTVPGQPQLMPSPPQQQQAPLPAPERSGG